MGLFILEPGKAESVEVPPRDHPAEFYRDCRKRAQSYFADAKESLGRYSLMRDVYHLIVANDKAETASMLAESTVDARLRDETERLRHATKIEIGKYRSFYGYQGDNLVKVYEPTPEMQDAYARALVRYENRNKPIPKTVMIPRESLSAVAAAGN